MSEVDPGTNGDMHYHDRPARKGTGRWPVDPAHRGRSIVTIAVVSASVGAFGLLSLMLGGVLRHFLGVPIEALFVLAIAVIVAGIWVGAWLSGRLTGGNRRRYIASGIGGCVGLVVAIALAYAGTKVLGGILELAAILSPGAIAAIAAIASDPTRRERPAVEP